MKLLNRVSGATWGASQDLLKTTYTTYVRPAILYGCETTVTASATARGKLELAQNVALRSITGAAKSTPIDAMRAQTGIEPINVRVDAAAMMLSEKIHPPSGPSRVPAQLFLRSRKQGTRAEPGLGSAESA